MRRVLVTGAGGQLAIELERWAPAGVEVVSLGVERLDVTSAAQVGAALAEAAPDIVMNAAAYTAVDKAETEPAAADAVNHRGVELLRGACDSFGARLVHFSTDYVFDGRSGSPYLPGDETNPLSVYGHTKRDGEVAALRSPGSLVIRTAWLYGAHGRNFVRTMIKLMQERDEVRVVADQVGTPTSAAGLARAAWSLAGLGARGIHHWTDAGVASWYDLAVAVRDEADAIGFGTRRARVVPIRTADYPTAAVRPAMSVLSKDATWALLRSGAPHWREGLREMLSELASMHQVAADPASRTEGP